MVMENRVAWSQNGTSIVKSGWSLGNIECTQFAQHRTAIPSRNEVSAIECLFCLGVNYDSLGSAGRSEKVANCWVASWP